MRTATWLRKILLGVVMLGLVSISMAQNIEFKPFTADVTISSSGSMYGGTQTQRWYITKGKKRIESIDYGQTTIIRRDKNVIWTTNPQSKTYLETHIDPNGQTLKSDVSQTTGGVNPSDRPVGTLSGTETIGGQLADRYDGGNSSSYYMHGTTVPLKIVTNVGQMKIVDEFRNIQIGDPAPDLFEVPSGYQKEGDTIDLEKQQEELHRMMNQAR